MLAYLLELGKTEFVAYCKGDEAKRKVAEHGIFFGGVCAVVKSYAEIAEKVRPYYNAGYEICRNGGKTELLCKAGKQKT